MNFKKNIILLFILALAFNLTSCTGDKGVDDNKNSKGDVSKQKVSGGELDIPVTHVKALNPLLNADSSVYYFNKLIFEGLFEFNEKLQPVEKLVESYDINSDGSIDIVLKKNVKWHNGQELKASDVAFTVDTIKYGVLNAKYKDLISDIYKEDGVLNINNIISVDVKGDKKLKITFEGNKNNILEILTFPIISSHAFDEDFEKALEEEKYTPIGTGPYKQIKYEKLKFINLESTDDYWGDKPYIKKVKGRILKDEDLSLTSFESGQMDATFSLGTDWEKYSQDEKVNIHEFPSRRYEFLAINSKSKTLEGEVGVAIRKAIAYGINRKSIIDRVYLGHATVTDTPINPKSYLTTKELNKTYEYDVKKARSVLEEAGFIDEDGDGIYEDKQGKPISITLTTNSYNELRVRTLDMVSEDLKNIGINVEKDYEIIPPVDLEDGKDQSDWDKFQSKIDSGKFEIALMGWETSFTEDISYMFSSDAGKSNFIDYKNEKMDKVIGNIKSSFDNKNKVENYVKAQKIILEDLPYVSLFFTNGAILSNKKISGEIDPNYMNIYTNIENWFIPKQYQSDTK